MFKKMLNLFYRKKPSNEKEQATIETAEPLVNDTSLAENHKDFLEISKKPTN